jgi:hypothetical protein
MKSRVLNTVLSLLMILSLPSAMTAAYEPGMNSISDSMEGKMPVTEATAEPMEEPAAEEMPASEVPAEFAMEDQPALEPAEEPSPVNPESPLPAVGDEPSDEESLDPIAVEPPNPGDKPMPKKRIYIGSACIDGGYQAPLAICVGENVSPCSPAPAGIQAGSLNIETLSCEGTQFMARSDTSSGVEGCPEGWTEVPGGCSREVTYPPSCPAKDPAGHDLVFNAERGTCYATWAPKCEAGQILEAGECWQEVEE